MNHNTRIHIYFTVEPIMWCRSRLIISKSIARNWFRWGWVLQSSVLKGTTCIFSRIRLCYHIILLQHFFSLLQNSGHMNVFVWLFELNEAFQYQMFVKAHPLNTWRCCMSIPSCFAPIMTTLCRTGCLGSHTLWFCFRMSLPFTSWKYIQSLPLVNWR